MIKRWAIGLAALAMLAGCAAWDFVRGYASTRSADLAGFDLAAYGAVQRGAIYFAHGDFGALDTDAMETHAVPWKLAATALVLQEVEQSGAPMEASTLKQVLQKFGFLYPARIANWPAGSPPPHLDGPLGLNRGLLVRSTPAVAVEVANLGCASCHAGVGYDAAGSPKLDVAVLGAPNTSLDLEAYVQAVYAAFADRDPEQIIRETPKLFPGVSPAEMASLRRFVAPRLRQRMAKIKASGGQPLPFVNGAPGLTNGVAALKMQLNQLGAEARAAERGFTSIPDLSDRHLRSSLLYDGAYMPFGVVDGPRSADAATDAHLDALGVVTAFFTVPSMGVSPARAQRHVGAAKDVMRFLSVYRAPRFPGKIDRALATKGRDLFAQRCASCHGGYDSSVEAPSLISFPNRIAPFDTDGARAAAFAPNVATAVQNSQYGKLLVARSTRGYVAPILSGLWMSAPYLHNGSVPTLRAFLDPHQRPAKFLVGGHRLDFDAVGIAGTIGADGVMRYAGNYTPWSTPALIDTKSPGFSNAGHATEVEGLQRGERDALLEYLKLL